MKILLGNSKNNKPDCLGEDITQEVDSLTNPTSSNKLDEGLHGLGSNCFITDSPYDIKNLLLNKPKLYRILYDANIDMYMIGDGREVIHQDLLEKAFELGYYAELETNKNFHKLIRMNAISKTTRLYAQSGIEGFYNDINDRLEFGPYLLYMVFSPDDEFSLGEDGYDGKLKFDFGSLLLRDADQGLIDNCDLIRILQKQSWANESMNLNENIENDFKNFESKCFKIANQIAKEIESKLDKYGFEINIVTDYEDYGDDYVGMFLSSEQDNASVFPIVINPQVIYNVLKEDNLENSNNSIVYAIKSTLWHETGHGIVSYLSDIYEFDWDEEDVVEEFAICMCEMSNPKCELLDVLNEAEQELNEDITNNPTLLYRGRGNNNNPTNKFSGGRFYADNLEDASEYGDLIQVVELLPNAKLLKYNNSYDYCEDNGLLDKEYDIIPKLTGKFTTLRDAWEELSWNGDNPNLYCQISQYIICQELSKQGYDGVEWLDEDDLIPHQYQIWNDKVIKHIKDVDENGKELKENMNESFVSNLVPGECYYFNKNNKVYYGKYKRKTNAWYFFEDENGKEIMTSIFSSVADNKEEIENLLGLVDKIEKDTKVPPQVPNRFTRVPNQHYKPMGESNMNHHKDKLTKIINNIATKIINDGWYKDYDDETTLYNEVIDFVQDILHSDNQDNYISSNDYEFIKDETDVAGIRNKNAYGGGKYEFDTDFCDKVANKVLELSRVKNESNELEQRAKKHKKKSKGMGWHMAVNAGDVEKGIEVFNNATSCSSGECAPMGESQEKQVYHYEGPIYYRRNKIADWSDITTKANSLNIAIRNVLYKAANGADDLYNYDIVDSLVKKVDKPIEHKEKPRCQTCGYELNDIGDCPVCDYGEDDLLESLTDLEALWMLNRLD